MDKEIVMNGGHGTVLAVKGKVEGKAIITYLFSFEELKVKALRLDSVVYAFQGKLVALFHWKVGESYSLMMPLEGRGRIDWEAIQGLNSPKDSSGIAIELLGEEDLHYITVMDFTKR